MLITRPPMGWNSWNTFTKDIDEKMILETADAMVAEGLRDAGYEYLVIDDCWSERERDENGQLVADPVKFPHGMKYVADYVHSKGLKFGMYSCDGTRTCADYPASFGHEFDDARYFASVGVDYLKYDNCYKPSTVPGKLLYNRMSMALKASGRDIVFSACNWGAEDVEQWIRSTGAHLYRSTGDITDTFVSMKDIAEGQLEKLPYAGPGCFNDVDMLIAGLYGKGNMIAIDQDAECRPPFVIKSQKDVGMQLFRHLENGEYAFGFFNFMDKASPYFFRCNLYDVGLPDDGTYGFEITDVFTGETLGCFSESFQPAVAPHDCRVFRAKLVKMK